MVPMVYLSVAKGILPLKNVTMRLLQDPVYIFVEEFFAVL
jgi:hypothetical protein